MKAARFCFGVVDSDLGRVMASHGLRLISVSSESEGRFSYEGEEE
jgi:hypothetical protein